MHDEGHGATSFAPGERATRERIRATNPTDEVLSNVGSAMNAAMADDPTVRHIVAHVDAMQQTAPPRPPKIELLEDDGEPFRRFTPDGPFEAWLILRGKPSIPGGGLSDDAIPVIIELEFPNADIARDHLRPIGHALGILNDVLARAYVASSEPIPDAATCAHHVRLERFGRLLAMQATCDRCLTVLAPDVVAWLNEHDYGHLTDKHRIRDGETAASIIQDAANRGR